MKLHTIVLSVLVVFCCMFAHGCVSASRVTAHAAKDAQLVDAINADTGAAPATRTAVQASMDDAAEMESVAHAQVTAAQSGDWKSLLLSVVGLAATGAATGVATYKKVNKDRDVSSPQRTQSDLVNLGLKPGTLEVAPKAGA